MSDIVDLLKEAKGDVEKESIELNIEECKNALSEVDSQMKNLPATAQVLWWFCQWNSVLIIFSENISIYMFFVCLYFRLQLSKVSTLLIASTEWKRPKKIQKVLLGSGEKVAIDFVPLGTS